MTAKDQRLKGPDLLPFQSLDERSVRPFRQNRGSIKITPQVETYPMIGQVRAAQDFLFLYLFGDHAVLRVEAIAQVDKQPYLNVFEPD